MEVNSNNLNLGAVGRLSAFRTPAPTTKPIQKDQVDLTSSAALEKAMHAVPDVRAEAVARGAALIGQVDYPPMETIHKISNLLALNIGGEEATA